MKTKADSDQLRSETSPLEMQPENVDEANLQATLRVLVASGKISAEDVLAAWRLAFENEQLRRDAMRYRFVRTADRVPISSEAARDPVAYDAAIDREMAKNLPPSCKTRSGCSENGCLGWCDEYRPDPALKPDIAALKRRLAEDPGFAAQVTGDRPPTPVGWSDTDWLKHLEEIRQDQETYHRGPLPETGWD